MHGQEKVPAETLQDTDVEETEAAADEDVREWGCEGVNVCWACHADKYTPSENGPKECLL